MSQNQKSLTYHILTPDRWGDFEELFGPRGACGGCWCMWWRLRNKAYEAQKGETNRSAMKRIVDSGSQPGILAYDDDQPIGWCAVAPREAFVRLETSRIFKPVDDQPVWSIVCLFVSKKHRGCGAATGLLMAAIDFVKKNGGHIIEGYAVEPKEGRLPDAFAYHGPASAFRKAGFTEVVRRSETRPIMRCYLD